MQAERQVDERAPVPQRPDGFDLHRHGAPPYMPTAIDLFEKARRHERLEQLQAARDHDLMPYFRVLEGPAMFEDYRARERRALEIHDNIVQGLTAVKWSLEAGQPDAAHQAADRTLEQAQKIIGELLDNHPDAAELGPGSLRREMATPPMPTGAS